MALEDAEAIMVTLMPADAVLVQRTLTEFGEPADYYTSASLATRFDADYPFWQDTGPGAFFVHYYIDGGSGLVASAMIGLGD